MVVEKLVSPKSLTRGITARAGNHLASRFDGNGKSFVRLRKYRNNALIDRSNHALKRFDSSYRPLYPSKKVKSFRSQQRPNSGKKHLNVRFNGNSNDSGFEAYQRSQPAPKFTWPPLYRYKKKPHGNSIVQAPEKTTNHKLPSWLLPLYECKAERNEKIDQPHQSLYGGVAFHKRMEIGESMRLIKLKQQALNHELMEKWSSYYVGMNKNKRKKRNNSSTRLLMAVEELKTRIGRMHELNRTFKQKRYMKTMTQETRPKPLEEYSNIEHIPSADDKFLGANQLGDTAVASRSNNIFYPQNSTAYSQNSNSYPLNSNSYPQNSATFPPNVTTYPQNSTSYPQNSTNYPQNSMSYPQNSMAYSQNSSIYSQNTMAGAQQSSLMNHTFTAELQKPLAINDNSIQKPTAANHNMMAGLQKPLTLSHNVISGTVKSLTSNQNSSLPTQARKDVEELHSFDSRKSSDNKELKQHLKKSGTYGYNDASRFHSEEENLVESNLDPSKLKERIEKWKLKNLKIVSDSGESLSHPTEKTSLVPETDASNRNNLTVPLRTTSVVDKIPDVASKPVIVCSTVNQVGKRSLSSFPTFRVIPPKGSTRGPFVLIKRNFTMSQTHFRDKGSWFDSFKLPRKLGQFKTAIHQPSTEAKERSPQKPCGESENPPKSETSELKGKNSPDEAGQLEQSKYSKSNVEPSGDIEMKLKMGEIVVNNKPWPKDSRLGNSRTYTISNDAPPPESYIRRGNPNEMDGYKWVSSNKDVLEEMKQNKLLTTYKPLVPDHVKASIQEFKLPLKAKIADYRKRIDCKRLRDSPHSRSISHRRYTTNDSRVFFSSTFFTKSGLLSSNNILAPRARFLNTSAIVKLATPNNNSSSRGKSDPEILISSDLYKQYVLRPIYGTHSRKNHADKRYNEHPGYAGRVFNNYQSANSGLTSPNVTSKTYFPNVRPRSIKKQVEELKCLIKKKNCLNQPLKGSNTSRMSNPNESYQQRLNRLVKAAKESADNMEIPEPKRRYSPKRDSTSNVGDNDHFKWTVKPTSKMSTGAIHCANIDSTSRLNHVSHTKQKKNVEPLATVDFEQEDPKLNQPFLNLIFKLKSVVDFVGRKAVLSGEGVSRSSISRERLGDGVKRALPSTLSAQDLKMSGIPHVVKAKPKFSSEASKLRNPSVREVKSELYTALRDAVNKKEENAPRLNSPSSASSGNRGIAEDLRDVIREKVRGYNDVLKSSLSTPDISTGRPPINSSTVQNFASDVELKSVPRAKLDLSGVDKIFAPRERTSPALKISKHSTNVQLRDQPNFKSKDAEELEKSPSFEVLHKRTSPGKQEIPLVSDSVQSINDTLKSPKVGDRLPAAPHPIFNSLNPQIEQTTSVPTSDKDQIPGLGINAEQNQGKGQEASATPLQSAAPLENEETLSLKQEHPVASNKERPEPDPKAAKGDDNLSKGVLLVEDQSAKQHDSIGSGAADLKTSVSQQETVKEKLPDFKSSYTSLNDSSQYDLGSVSSDIRRPERIQGHDDQYYDVARYVSCPDCGRVYSINCGCKDYENHPSASIVEPKSHSNFSQGTFLSRYFPDEQETYSSDQLVDLGDGANSHHFMQKDYGNWAETSGSSFGKYGDNSDYSIDSVTYVRRNEGNSELLSKEPLINPDVLKRLKLPLNIDEELRETTWYNARGVSR